MVEKKDKKLTHLGESGQARMVAVTKKSDTVRKAMARGFVDLSQEVLELIKKNELKKGNALEVARVAGIMAAKKTHELVPLCHPLLLTQIDVQASLTDRGVKIESTVVCVGKTGVEMEALTAVSVAALTIYDMCKSVDKSIKIRDVFLLKKSGGRSGDFNNPDVFK